MASLSSALDIHKLYRNFLASAQFSMICRYRTREILLGTQRSDAEVEATGLPDELTVSCYKLR